jgi:hypothetical protein
MHARFIPSPLGVVERDRAAREIDIAGAQVADQTLATIQVGLDNKPKSPQRSNALQTALWTGLSGSHNPSHARDLLRPETDQWLVAPFATDEVNRDRVDECDGKQRQLPSWWNVSKSKDDPADNGDRPYHRQLHSNRRALWDVAN